MKKDTFIKRLENGSASNVEYTKDELSGMINIWKHKEQFIITWEECKEGDQWNESAYTKDERYVFDSVDEVIEFIELESIDYEKIKP